MQNLGSENFFKRLLTYIKSYVKVYDFNFSSFNHQNIEDIT